MREEERKRDESSQQSLYMAHISHLHWNSFWNFWKLTFAPPSLTSIGCLPFETKTSQHLLNFRHGRFSLWLLGEADEEKSAATLRIPKSVLYSLKARTRKPPPICDKALRILSRLESSSSLRSTFSKMKAWTSVSSSTLHVPLKVWAEELSCGVWKFNTSKTIHVS